MGGSTTLRSGTKLDEDTIEKLVQKICSNIIKQLEQSLTAKTDRIETKLNEVCDSFNKINKSVVANKKEIDNFNIRLDVLEQHAKRNSLRICGFKEADEENLAEVIPQFIRQTLKVNCSSKDLNYIYRLPIKNDGKPLKPSTNHIIANFISSIKRDEVFKAKKLLKDSSVAIFEDLTSTRFKLLGEAKKKYGNKSVWSMSGKIYYLDPITQQKSLY